MRAIRHNLLLFNWRTSTNSPIAGGTDRRRALSFVGNTMSDQSAQTSAFSRPKSLLNKVLARNLNEGNPLMANRNIASEFKGLDPFLALDHFSGTIIHWLGSHDQFKPALVCMFCFLLFFAFLSAISLLLFDFAVTYPGGFTDHPHRGFETVTYILEGGIIHQDFAGNKGTIRAGDVQWMTAGRGIIHSEMPAGEGTHTGVQLWINLSRKDKMIEPKYQDLLREDIPKAEKDGVEVKVIAGEALGVHSQVYTRTPAMFLDCTLKPEAQLHQSIPESWNSFVYVLEGEGIFGTPSSSPAGAYNVVFLGPGDGLSVWNKSSEPLRFLLIAGQPLNEPVAQYGPFVMNTQSEIQKAMEDYQYCKNGFENGKNWRSQ